VVLVLDVVVVEEVVVVHLVVVVVVVAQSMHRSVNDHPTSLCSMVPGILMPSMLTTA
jgi:hypothetical protein